ncbi:anti-anti-sigma factor [Legionella geestiana]|uniref:Anti-anti-sigma factor n=1 Tax=Legionella geestiana TaxID=45065 RepID=A0A0W0TRV2_9GAMM|nr:STAS domain-containing protein [Legionella geestiana]KTC98335.1 anti-anti-sigma factor [Legionella geestiana]QBS11381.1 anti-sigma factor antagonist [Legionella geestiana]QDQ38933.1 STAS domain-containing protein [Legionella geestiana]STX53964.1 anti-anti-sigma factor [Legionella geestiana]
MASKDYVLPEQLAYGNAGEERERLSRWVEQQVSADIRLSLASVSWCDTAGLALLIEAHRICRKNGKTLQFLAIPEQIALLSRFCGVESLLRGNVQEQ